MSNATKADIELKGETWVQFITLIRMAGEKKYSEKAKQRVRNSVASATSDLDRRALSLLSVTCVVFFKQLKERSDVYQSPFFVPELIRVLTQVFTYRNVPLFNGFVCDFLPVYLQYL